MSGHASAASSAASSTSVVLSVVIFSGLSGLVAVHPVVGCLAPVTALAESGEHVERVFSGLLTKFCREVVVDLGVFKLTFVKRYLDRSRGLVRGGDLDEWVGVGESFFANLAEVEVFADGTLESDADDFFDSAAVADNVLVSGHSGLSQFFSNGSPLRVSRLLDNLLNYRWTLSVELSHDELLDDFVLRERLLVSLLFLEAVVAVLSLAAALLGFSFFVRIGAGRVLLLLDGLPVGRLLHFFVGLHHLHEGRFLLLDRFRSGELILLDRLDGGSVGVKDGSEVRLRLVENHGLALSGNDLQTELSLQLLLSHFIGRLEVFVV